MATDFVAGMWAETNRKARKAQVSGWTEYHAHCGHARTDEASIVCDITEAYCTYTEEIRAKRQREAWRLSEPLVRSDGTRIERDHYLALQMNETAG